MTTHQNPFGRKFLSRTGSVAGVLSRCATGAMIFGFASASLWTAIAPVYAASMSAIGTQVTRELACSDARDQASRLAFADMQGRITWQGSCSCTQTSPNYWRCDLPFEYAPGNLGGGSVGGSSRTGWTSVGDPSHVELCAAAYTFMFRQHGAVEPREGRAVTSAIASSGGRDIAKPAYYALKNRIESGSVSQDAVANFTQECDRRYGFGFNG